MLKKIAGVLVSLAPVAALAAPPDVSSLVTTISDTLTPVTTIALAVLTVIVGTKVFKYIRRAL